jgi:RNA methyltransferase, TrmH family
MQQSGGQLLTPRSPRIVAAKKLQHRKYRDQQRLFLVEGPQAIRELLTVEKPPAVRIFGTPNALRRHEDLISTVQSRRIEICPTNTAGMNSLSETVTSQNLVAVCEFLDIPILSTKNLQLLALAVGISDPGNAGTLIRVADAAGAQAVVFTEGSVDPYNGKCVRASAGSIFHLDLIREAMLADIVATLRTANVQILATSSHSDVDLFDLADTGQLARPTAWLFGNEAHGLNSDLRQAADHQVAIPIYGRAESLNLATAAAICLYTSARAQH